MEKFVQPISKLVSVINEDNIEPRRGLKNPLFQEVVNANLLSELIDVINDGNAISATAVKDLTQALVEHSKYVGDSATLYNDMLEMLGQFGISVNTEV